MVDKDRKIKIVIGFLAITVKEKAPEKEALEEIIKNLKEIDLKLRYENYDPVEYHFKLDSGLDNISEINDENLKKLGEEINEDTHVENSHGLEEMKTLCEKMSEKCDKDTFKIVFYLSSLSEPKEYPGVTFAKMKCNNIHMAFSGTEENKIIIAKLEKPEVITYEQDEDINKPDGKIVFETFELPLSNVVLRILETVSKAYNCWLQEKCQKN